MGMGIEMGTEMKMEMEMGKGTGMETEMEMGMSILVKTTVMMLYETVVLAYITGQYCGYIDDIVIEDGDATFQ